MNMNKNYTKLKEGQTDIRILSSAIIGFEYWNTENKPVRSKEPFAETPDIKIGKDGKSKVKHFWAFIVWNYTENSLQVMEITQVTIMNAVKALVDNEKWGDPKGYDITITRTGEGLETEYQTMPNPHSEIEEEVKALYEETTIDLEKLYTGEDPFAV